MGKGTDEEELEPKRRGVVDPALIDALDIINGDNHVTRPERVKKPSWKVAEMRRNKQNTVHTGTGKGAVAATHTGRDLECINLYSPTEGEAEFSPIDHSDVEEVEVETQQILKNILKEEGDKPLLEVKTEVLVVILMFVPMMQSRLPKAVVNNMRQLSTDYLSEAAQGEGEESKVLGYKKFLLLPILALAARKETINHSKNKAIVERVEKLMEGKDIWKELSLNQLELTNKYSPEDAETELFIKGVLLSRSQWRAYRLMEEGMVSRAVKALDNTKVCHHGKSTVAALRDLYPPAMNTAAPEVGPIMCRVLKDYNPVTEIETQPQLLRKIIKSKGRLVNPGVFNYRNEYLVQLIESDTANGAFLSQLAKFIDGIIRADLPLAILHSLQSTPVTVLSKKNGGIRPIIKIQHFRKLAGTVAIAANQHNFAAVLGKEQFGIGVQGSADIIAHSMRSIFQNKVANGEWDIAQFDGTNGYGNIDRTVIKQMCETYFPTLVPMLNQFYGESTTVDYRTDSEVYRINAEQGVCQGDTLAGLFFSLAVAPLVHDFRLRWPEFTSECVITMFLDDINAAGSTQALSLLRIHLETCGPDYGYIVNRKKQKIMMGGAKGGGERQHEYGECPKVTGAEPNDYGVDIMGIPIGSPEYTDAWLEGKLDTLRAKGTQLEQFPDSQMRWTMADTSLRNELTYIYRALPSKALGDFRNQANEVLLSVFASCCGYTIQELKDLENFTTIQKQLESPLRFAGYDFLFSAARGDAAYAGAIASVYEQVVGVCRVPTEDPDTLLITDPQFQPDIVSALHRLGHIIGEPQLDLAKVLSLKPTQVRDNKFQKFLTQRAHSALHKIHLQEATQDSKQHLKKVEGTSSGLFLRQVCRGTTRITSIYFQTALSRRSNMPLKLVHKPMKCICNKNEVDRKGVHLLRCATKNTHQGRHDVIVNAFADLARACGFAATVDPIGEDAKGGNTGFGANDGEIAQQEVPESQASQSAGGLRKGHKRRGRQFDLALYNVSTIKNIKSTNEQKTVVFDVAVTDKDISPYTKLKRTKYADLVVRHNLIFHPLIFNTLGGWNQSVEDFVVGCCIHLLKTKEGESGHAQALNNLIGWWRRRLCTALQRAVGWQLHSRFRYIINNEARRSKQHLPHWDTLEDELEDSSELIYNV